MGRCPVLLTRLTFEPLAAFRWPCEMEFNMAGTGGAIVFPDLLSDATLEEEFFRCREPDLEFVNTEFNGVSLVRVIFLLEYERDIETVTDGAVPAVVAERMDILSSARLILL
jgi:hypothetical protein